MSINPFSRALPKPSEAPKKSGFTPARLAQALFSKQVKFKRGEDGYKLTLESESVSPQNLSAAVPSLAIPKRPAAAALPPGADQAKPVTALSCLVELMDSAPGSRNAFRHLASIEASLQSKDAEGLFLFDLNVAHLKHALRQLDGLWMEPAPAALAELRAKITDALAAQEKREAEAVQSRGSFNVLSTFMVDEKMQVSEGRASDFHQLSESWGGPSLVPIER